GTTRQADRYDLGSGSRTFALFGRFAVGSITAGRGDLLPAVELAGMSFTAAPRRGGVGRMVLALVLVAVALVGPRLGTPAKAAGDPVLLAAGDVGTCDAAGALAGGSAATAKL